VRGFSACSSTVFLHAHYLLLKFATEAIKKGTAYMNIWMYVIREMEDALDVCD
jgi:hypothetical protein